MNLDRSKIDSALATLAYRKENCGNSAGGGRYYAKVSIAVKEYIYSIPEKEFILTISSPSNIKEKLIKFGLNPGNGREYAYGLDYLSERAQSLNLIINKFEPHQFSERKYRKNPKIWGTSDAEFKDLARTCSSQLEMLHKLGANASSRSALARRAELLGIKLPNGLHRDTQRHYTDDDIFIENCKVTSRTVKLRVIKLNLFKEVCALCGLEKSGIIKPLVFN